MTSIKLLSYRIRKAKKKDLKSLITLLKILFSLEKDFEYNYYKQKKGLLLLLNNKESSIINLCEYNNKIVGMITGQIVVSTAEGSLSIWIEDLVVLKKFRGKGIGTSLLQSIYKWGQLKGCKRIQLLADKNNYIALDFYKHQKWISTQLICLRKRINPTKM